MNEAELKARVRDAVLARHFQETGEILVPVNVSARHVHLDQNALSVLFGSGHQLTPMRGLVQPGQFACEETVTLRGKKGALQNVRVLGPLRGSVQAELSVTDCYALGVAPVVRLSGNHEGTSPVVVQGPMGEVEIPRGAMVAMRHVHMPTELAKLFGMENGDTLSLITTGGRPAVLMQFVARVSDDALLEAHVDTDEANACGIVNDMLCRAVKEGKS